MRRIRTGTQNLYHVCSSSCKAVLNIPCNALNGTVGLPVVRLKHDLAGRCSLLLAELEVHLEALLAGSEEVELGAHCHRAVVLSEDLASVSAQENDVEVGPAQCRLRCAAHWHTRPSALGTEHGDAEHAPPCQRQQHTALMPAMLNQANDGVAATCIGNCRLS